MANETQKQEIISEIDSQIGQGYGSETNPCGFRVSFRTVGRLSSPDVRMEDLVHFLANREVKNVVGDVAYGNTRFAKGIQDKGGNFGAFQLEVYYQTIAVMEGRVNNSHDLVYTVSREGDLFEAGFLKQDVCRYGAEGDTTRHHSFILGDIVNGELNYIESVKTEFDYSRISSITLSPKPRATKREDINYSHKIEVPNTTEIEEILRTKRR